ncbi:hypothetical protein [Dactylosporangium sp. CA-139066]|uniref:hypothetical protein n=1 Tax=Dactylosporangium sp. CA-139066 TaxID=3239930 RepID=UPI003D917A9A
MCYRGAPFVIAIAAHTLSAATRTLGHATLAPRPAVFVPRGAAFWPWLAVLADKSGGFAAGVRVARGSVGVAAGRVVATESGRCIAERDHAGCPLLAGSRRHVARRR